MATTDIYHVSGGLKGRHAAAFIGGDSNDVITSAGAGAAANTNNDLSGTFTAWINIPNITETACTIVAFNDTNADEFIDFAVKAGLLTCTISDAGVDQVTTQEDAVGLTPHVWHHVAVVQANGGTGPKFYIDGVLRAATNDVTTDVDEWVSTQLEGIDSLTIGMLASNSTTTQEFKGAISDVKYWNKALTPAEILSDYNGAALSDDSTYLQNHWDMDEDYVDSGIGLDNGTATGDVTLINNYSEFTSRLRYSCGVPVVADSVICFADDGTGHAIVIQAA
jgi:hypothetical protein